MDKIDLLILSIVVLVMVVCFSLATKWSYFFAGICSAFAFTVVVGCLAQLKGHKQRENLVDRPKKAAHTANANLAEAMI